MKRFSFIISSFVFIVMAGSVVTILIVAAHLLFPEKQMWAMKKQPQPTFLQALRMAARKNSGAMPRRNAKSKGKTANRKVGAPGPGSTVFDKKQMAYRQSLLAHQMLTNYRGENPDKAWDRAKTVRGDGLWKQYEILRLKTRIISEKFDKNKDRALLPEYLQSATKAAASEYANFEDLFYLAHAQLYSGNVARAEKSAHQAYQTWPVQDMMRGYAFLFIVLADAAQNRDHALKNVDAFKENFREWLYSEIYVPELEFVESVYPHAALVKACHGRLLQITHDDAAALKKYREALRGPRLSGSSKAIIKGWIKEILAKQAEGA